MRELRRALVAPTPLCKIRETLRFQEPDLCAGKTLGQRSKDREPVSSLAIKTVMSSEHRQSTSGDALLLPLDASHLYWRFFPAARSHTVLRTEPFGDLLWIESDGPTHMKTR